MAIEKIKEEAEEQNESDALTDAEIKNYRKAGKIAKKTKEFCLKNIKTGQKLSEIAEKIEAKIQELSGEPAFPVNLSIDDVAAHYTPTLEDETAANGLLKIDIGVHIEGRIVDTALTIDLTPSGEHKKMIEATENALKNAIDIVKAHKEKTKLREIGKEIHKTITESKFSPIRNLSGHSISKWQIHAGITIPNYDNGNENEIGRGIFAIEPFATTGEGVVYEGQDSKEYELIKERKPRDEFARKVLDWIKENKKTLPFSERELERKFGSRAKLAIKMLLQAEIIKSYPKLIEKSRKPVAQAEHTIMIYGGKVEILT